MPNYEFYAQMAKGREQFYVDAYSAAYRDLMNVYKSEVAVQKMLYDQLTLDKENNQALLKLIANPPSDVALEEFQELVKLQEKYDDLKLRASISSSKNYLEAKKAVDREYQIPPVLRTQLENLVEEKQGSAQGLPVAVMDDRTKSRLVATIRSIPTDEGQQQAMAMYLPLFADIYEADTEKSLATSIGLDYVDGQSLNALREQQIKNMRSKVSTSAGRDAKSTARQIKNLVDTKYSEYLTILEEGDEGFKIIEKHIVDTPDVQRLSEMPQFQAIAPPQEKDILRKTAEYYKPYGTEDFKEGIAEIEANKQAQAQAKENLMTQLPEWAPRAYEVGPKVFETIDKTDEELNVGLPEDFAFKQLGSPTFNIEEAIKAIDTEFTDPKDQQAAVTILIRDRMKKHRLSKSRDLDKLLK
tara:strand:+ start:5886 stop:7124 length:1239 start_codon:yes stop_codon:yes gene_type:complete